MNENMNLNANLTSATETAAEQCAIPEGMVMCIECGALELLDDCTEIRPQLFVGNDCLARDYVQCAECGLWLRKDAPVLTEVASGALVCDDCLDRAYIQCDDCGGWFPTDDMTEVAHGGVVCDTCLDNGYMYCESCEEYHPESEIHNVNPGTRDEMYVCEDCLRYRDDFRRCSHCGEWYTTDHITLSDAIRDICEGCEGDWCECYECGSVLRRDYAEYDESEDEYYCEDCARSHTGVHDYGYKPSPVFGTTDANDGRRSYGGEALTFGVELECDDGDDTRAAVSEIYALSDRVYCKHDGSLNGGGYEIVTHPGTLAWHRECFPWEAVCEASRDHGFRSHDTDTCGLHVHVGCNQLGDDPSATAAKMALIVSRHKDAFIRFSRRKGESRWACYMEPFDLSADDTEALREVYDKLCRSGRYLAVNVQPCNTVELRIFRGSLVPETVLAAVELVSNLAMYAKDHTLTECLAVTWDELTSYETYPELTAYCAQRMADMDTSTGAAFNRRSPLTTDDSIYPWAPSSVEYETEADSTLHPGDVVYAPGSQFVAGRCGLVLDVLRNNSWVVAAWFVPVEGDGRTGLWKSDADTEHGRHGSCWGVDRKNVHRVTKIGGYTLTNTTRANLLHTYKTYGLLPGDHVSIVDPRRMDARTVEGLRGTYLLNTNSTRPVDDPHCDCVWDGFDIGHNSFDLRPGANDGWRIVASNLRRVDD